MNECGCNKLAVNEFTRARGLGNRWWQGQAGVHPDLDELSQSSTLTQDGTVNYRSKRADRSRTGGWIPALMINGACPDV